MRTGWRLYLSIYAPARSGANTLGWGPAPYYGPTGGLYDGLVPSEFLADFPWSSLECYKMNLQPADSSGDPIAGSSTGDPANSSSNSSPATVPANAVTAASRPANACSSGCQRAAIKSSVAAALVRRAPKTRRTPSRTTRRHQSCKRTHSLKCKPPRPSPKCRRTRKARNCTPARPKTRRKAR